MTPSLSDYIPPQKVANNAQKGLTLREKFKRGGTHIGVARAQELMARNHVDPDTIKRIVSYFARHEVDKKAKNFGNEDNPSAGYIAWLLWGGNEGKEWAGNLKKNFPTRGKKKSI